MKKLEKRKVEHGMPDEKGNIQIFVTEEWNIEDIANKINEIIDLLSEMKKNE